MLTDKRLIVNPVNEGLKPIIFPYKKIEGFNITGNQIELFIGKEYPIKIEITDNISDNIGKVVHAVGKILELES